MLEYKIAHADLKTLYYNLDFIVPNTKGSWRKYKKEVRKDFKSRGRKVIFTWRISINDIFKLWRRNLSKIPTS
jgi:hypothetical protein